MQDLVLERYLIPGGSGGSFKRDGFTFDVGAPMIFGLASMDTPTCSRALADVGRRGKPSDPVQLEYHLPNGLTMAVDRDYDGFIARMSDRFPMKPRASALRHLLAGVPLFRCYALAVAGRSGLSRQSVLQSAAGLPRATRWLLFTGWRCGAKAHQNQELLRLIDMEASLVRDAG